MPAAPDRSRAARDRPSRPSRDPRSARPASSSTSSSSCSSRSGGRISSIHAEVAARAVHLHARVLRRPGRLLVGRQERVLEGRHQAVGGDALLALEDSDGLDDLLGHRSPSSRLLRLISEYGIDTTPSSAATVTSSSLAPTSSPVKLLWPSLGSRSAHARATAEEAAEVVRLRQRPLGTRRGDLERRSPRAGRAGGASPARRARDPPRPGWSMNRRSRSAPAFSHASSSTSGSAVERRCSMSV